MSARVTLGRRALRLLLLAAIAVLVGSLRFLTISFTNDHFVHLTAAQQMLFGDWPTRDFIDIGRPLQIVVSAAGQRWVGHTLFAEGIVVSVSVGLAAACTAALVFNVTGSPTAALGAVLIEAAAFPRTYSYPKLLATAAGLLLIGRFLQRPGSFRRFLMAVGTAVAFLFRHDLGLFVGIGGLLATALAIPAAALRERWRSGLMFAGTVLALVAPYLLYVELYGGLRNYFATALQEYQGIGYVWPNPLVLTDRWESQLVYLFHALPFAALTVCGVQWRRDAADWSVRAVACISAVGIAENFGLIRHQLPVRTPDAIVPAVVLGAWLTSRAWRSRSLSLAVPSTLLFVLSGIAVVELGTVRDHLDRSNLTADILWQPALIASRFAQRSAVLHDRFGDDYSRSVVALRPFFSYLDRCTIKQHRLFLGSFIPEVAYAARRPFAGGSYEGNFRSPDNQRRAVERLRSEVAPFAVLYGGIDADLPILAAYLNSRYVPLADIPVPGDRLIRLMVDPTLPSTGRDVETGWPCFVNR